MKLFGCLSTKTKEELLRITKGRIYDINVELDQLMYDPSMHEMPSELPVYIAEAEAEITTLKKVENYLEKFEEW